MLKWVILYGFLASLVFILTSWQVIKSGKQERKFFRLMIILTGIFFFGRYGPGTPFYSPTPD